MEMESDWSEPPEVNKHGFKVMTVNCAWGSNGTRRHD